MPGPVSDSYARRDEVVQAIERVRSAISKAIGDPELRDIVKVSEMINEQWPDRNVTLVLRSCELRVIRFALDRALESV